MKLCVCAVYDEKAEAFAMPFFQQSEVLGIRAFTAAARDPDSLLSKFPRDYVLYKLAEYDDNLGRFENLDRPVQLMSAQQAVVQEGTPAIPLADPAVAQRLS